MTSFSTTQNEKIERLEKLDLILKKHIPRVTLGVVAVVVARNLSQAVSMSLVDVSRRLVDLKLPMKWV